MPNKLNYLQQKKLNPADELRELLLSLEESQIKVKSINSEQSLGLLHDLDQVETLLAQLDASGADLLPEQTRFMTVQAGLKKQAGFLLKALGGVDVLKKNRPGSASPEQWWWYVDERVAAQRRRLGRKVVIGLVIFLALVGGVVLLFQTVLAPSFEVDAWMEAQNRANTAINQERFQDALTFLEEGLAKIPYDPDLLLYKGVVQELLGDEAAAKQSFDQTQARLNDSLRFYLARSELELRVDRPAKAEGDARSALEINPNSAIAWLLLGQALEAQQKKGEAISAYQKAGDLAYANNDAQIYVTVRLALGRLSDMP